jgi:hypothetical protein
MNIKEEWSYLNAHRRAFKVTEIMLTGKSSWRSTLHDIDKYVLCLLPEKIERTIHRWISPHHDEFCIPTWRDFQSMVIDWECARITKPSKPLNARGTMERFYPHLAKYIEPILQSYGL